MENTNQHFLKIRNYKSIRDVEIEVKKFNIFIGEPNSGKSNILETLGLLSCIGNSGKISEYIRVNNLSDMFYNEMYNKSIEINFNNNIVEVFVEDERLSFNFKGKEFEKRVDYLNINTDLNRGYDLTNVKGEISANPDLDEFFHKTKFYLLPNVEKSYEYHGNTLYPPFGVNLFDVVKQNQECRDIIKDFLLEFDYKLNLNTSKKELAISKEVGGVILSYPLNTVADTIVSFITHIVAILSNKDSILIFEEPEGHVFPHYIKELAELISEDKTNTYFITSHNPYFLDTMIAKCDPENTCINLVYSKDFVTHVKQLNGEEMNKLTKGDPFFSMDKLLV